MDTDILCKELAIALDAAFNTPDFRLQKSLRHSLVWFIMFSDEHNPDILRRAALDLPGTVRRIADDYIKCYQHRMTAGTDPGDYSEIDPIALREMAPITPGLPDREYRFDLDLCRYRPVDPPPRPPAPPPPQTRRAPI